MSEPRTAAGRRLVARGSNNWAGDGWLETFAADVAEVEAEARSAGIEEGRAALAAAIEKLRGYPDDRIAGLIWVRNPIGHYLLARDVLALLAAPQARDEPAQ